METLSTYTVHICIDIPCKKAVVSTFFTHFAGIRHTTFHMIQPGTCSFIFFFWHNHTQHTCHIIRDQIKYLWNFSKDNCCVIQSNKWLQWKNLAQATQTCCSLNKTYIYAFYFFLLLYYEEFAYRYYVHFDKVKAWARRIIHEHNEMMHVCFSKYK